MRVAASGRTSIPVYWAIGVAARRLPELSLRTNIRCTRGYEELNDAEAQTQAKELGGIIRDIEMSVFVEHTSR